MKTSRAPARRWDALVVGGGAAGIFAALRAKECSPGLEVVVLERSPRPLRKVAISGGGRCNVTHHCQDLDWLLRCYPRGGPRLEAILGRFMPEDTVRWFAQRGVKTKVEPDGRIFPITDSSQTVIDCLLGQATKLGVPILTGTRVDRLEPVSKGFRLTARSGTFDAPRVLLACGGASKATEWLSRMGHEIVPDIPSLFTFECRHPVINDLPGLSVETTELTLLTEPAYQAEGPLLITHWGLSGPAVLKLSAFAARTLSALDYQATLRCDLLPELETEGLQAVLDQAPSSKQVATRSPFPEIPRRLWRTLVEHSKIPSEMTWGKLKTAARSRLQTNLKALELPVQGKGVFKEEFVTAGGLPLHELDPYTMESRKMSGLFVAGELLDVDGITGGFNFQNAWATGYIAGEAMAY